MHRILFEISGVIDQASSELLREYDPKQLYVLRVSTRRIRSILKHIGSHRSRHFRKTWGGFAAITNESRDWDVFLLTVKKLLPVKEYADFRKLNLERIHSSHEAVIEMLRSAHWRRHLAEWKLCLERTDETTTKEQDDAALGKALATARLAHARALELDDDRSWHKFRIAVKELRYVADSCMGDPARAQSLAAVIKSCKSLQILLGDWHDTVVQLNLLEELETAPVHEKLSAVIEQRKQLFQSQLRGNQRLFKIEI